MQGQQFKPMQFQLLLPPGLEKGKEKEQEIGKENTQNNGNVIMQTVESTEIKSDYKPKSNLNQKSSSVCPICNQSFPVDEINQHMKIELMNPNYLEEKKLSEQANKQSYIQQAQEISQNLQKFKNKRIDIGGQIEQALNQQEEQDQDWKLQNNYDGVSSSLTRTSASIFMMKKQQFDNSKLWGPNTNSNAYDNTKVAENQAISSMNPIYPNTLNQNSNLAKNTTINFQLQSKQQKDLKQELQLQTNSNYNLEQGQCLLREEIWQQKQPALITIYVRISEVLGAKCNLRDQIIQVQVAQQHTIKQVKQMLSQKLNEGVDWSTLNIKTNMFQSLKDDKTVSYYNLINKCYIELQYQGQ